MKWYKTRLCATSFTDCKASKVTLVEYRKHRRKVPTVFVLLKAATVIILSQCNKRYKIIKVIQDLYSNLYYNVGSWINVCHKPSLSISLYNNFTNENQFQWDTCHINMLIHTRLSLFDVRIKL